MMEGTPKGEAMTTSPERISAAASDLEEAILIASDGSVRIPEQTLREVVKLLAYGTDSGEFFDDFRSEVAPQHLANVTRYRINLRGLEPADVVESLSKRFPRALRISFPYIGFDSVVEVLHADPLRIEFSDGKIETVSE